MVALNKKNPAAVQTLGGETATGWDSTEKFPARLESFGILKQRGEDFTNWIKSGGVSSPDPRQKKVINSLDVCGEFLIFREYIEANRTRLIGGCTCKKTLLCALCAARRGVKNSKAYSEKFAQLKVQFPDHDIDFVTFTIKNGEDLMERFLHLKHSIQKLLKNRNHQGKGTGKSFYKLVTEMSKYIGGVFAFEFKRGENSNLWHPHIHMLVLRPRGVRVDVAILKQEWLEITGDSSVINIKPATDSGAFLEVFAYALKFSEMENIDRWNAAELLRSERLISSFGEVRGVIIDESDADDLLESEQPYYDLIFKWHSGRYSLINKVEKNPEIDAETAQTLREDAMMRSAAARCTQGE